EVLAERSARFVDGEVDRGWFRRMRLRSTDGVEQDRGILVRLGEDALVEPALADDGAELMVARRDPDRGWRDERFTGEGVDLDGEALGAAENGESGIAACVEAAPGVAQRRADR